MLQSYHEFQPCIEACLRTASIATKCALSCTEDPKLADLGNCIKFSIECATICNQTAQLLTLGSPKTEQALKNCIEACQKLAAECGKYKAAYCQECAKSCKQCVNECKQLETEPQLS
jgi:hypothetical protein